MQMKSSDVGDEAFGGGGDFSVNSVNLQQSLQTMFTSAIFIDAVLATSHTTPQKYVPTQDQEEDCYMSRACTSHEWIAVLFLKIPMSCVPPN